jgi:hypothetical protein
VILLKQIFMNEMLAKQMGNNKRPDNKCGGFIRFDRMKYLLLILLSCTCSGCEFVNMSNMTICSGDCTAGLGTKKWIDGSYLTCHWINGEPVGYGRQYFGSNSRFDGDYYAGAFNKGYCGYGVYYGKKSDGRYVGFWKDSKPEGYGENKFFNRSVHPGAFYKGWWKNGEYNGYGIWYGGDKGTWEHEAYIGYFKNGERSGFGRAYWPGEGWYEGQFKEGVMDGYGTYHFPGGAECRGYWENGYNRMFDSIRKAEDEKYQSKR